MSTLYASPRVVTELEQCYFYHTMDLPGLGTQTGAWDLRGRFKDYTGAVPMAGQRVLDVGCASGFLSFAAEEAGARAVVSMDMDTAARQHLLPFATSLYMTDHAAWVVQQTAGITRWHNAYWLAHRLYQSRAQVYYGDVYALPAALGTFDVVLVGSVLEHLGDPIRALASIAARCSHMLVLTTAMLPTEEPIAHFVGCRDRPEIDYTFWVYSLGVYQHVLGMLSFQIASLTTAEYHCELITRLCPLTALVATRVP